MSDEKKALEEVHGISSSVEVGDGARVVPGYGQTTKREGAKTKEVHNVSLPYRGGEVGTILTCKYSRPICSLPLRRQRLNDGARIPFICTVSIDESAQFPGRENIC